MIPSPAPELLAEAARLRLRLAAGGPLGRAPIGTVPIRWNEVDGPEVRPAAPRLTRAHRDSYARPRAAAAPEPEPRPVPSRSRGAR
jgi:hypothetical protein